MPKAKIAISLDADLLTLIKRLVADGYADSVSGYIEEAVAERAAEDEYDDEAFQADLDETFEQTGGQPTPDEIAWARRVIGGGS